MTYPFSQQPNSSPAYSFGISNCKIELKGGNKKACEVSSSSYSEFYVRRGRFSRTHAVVTGIGMCVHSHIVVLLKVCGPCEMSVATRNPKYELTSLERDSIYAGKQSKACFFFTIINNSVTVECQAFSSNSLGSRECYLESVCKDYICLDRQILHVARHMSYCITKK